MGVPNTRSHVRTSPVNISIADLFSFEDITRTLENYREELDRMISLYGEMPKGEKSKVVFIYFSTSSNSPKVF